MFPYKLSELFEKINNFINKKIYVICNCGFLEPFQSTLALNNIEYIINKKNGIFMGYLSIGCGEIIGLTKERKILKIFCCDFFKKIKIFKNNIDENNKIYLKTNIKLLN